MARVVLREELRRPSLPKVYVMFEIAEAGSVAVALTGAVLGWSLRPVFLRHRRAVVVAAAVLAAAGAMAYDALDAKPPADAAPSAVREMPSRVSASPFAVPLSPSSNEPWAEYLARAGRDAFTEGDYETATRYWLDASRLSPQQASELTDAIVRAKALAAERF